MLCFSDGGVSVGVKASKVPVICDTQLLVRSHSRTEHKHIIQRINVEIVFSSSIAIQYVSMTMSRLLQRDKAVL